ncbi:hypothetical protein POP15_146 [Pectobacterium phage POP15]|nr:hypothetical protein POP15_146 [Pectobacterium phage POP15]
MKATVRLSEGSEWVVNRMPNVLYPQFKKDLEEAITAIMHQYGYDVGIAMAFRESTPVYVERSK